MSTLTQPTRRDRRPASRAIIAGLAAGVMALSLTACRDDAGGGNGDGPFYEGETIEFYVPLAAGGGTDIAIRLFAKYLPEYIPGNPTAVVINDDHGGNSLIGASQYAQEGSNGGLRLVGLGASNHSAFLFGNAQVEYTPNGDLIPLAGTQGGGLMVARADTGLTAGADLKDYTGTLYFGGRRPEGSFIKRALTFQLLGVQVEELLGYEGAANLDVAFQQGELNVNGVSTSTFLQDSLPLVESGEQVVLWTEGLLGPDGEIVRDPAVPDWPHVGEVYEQIYGEPPSGQEWEAYKLLAAADGGVDKGLYIHEDAPAEAVEALLAAVDEMLADPAFVEEAKVQMGDYPVLNGPDFGATVEANLVNADQQALDWLKDWVRDRYGVDLAES